MKKIKIKLRDLVKINHLQMEIFEEEDSDYVDGRVVRSKERAIDRILNKISPNKEVQRIVYTICNKHLFNTEDITFKPICDDLRSLGYEIELDKEK